MVDFLLAAPTKITPDTVDFLDWATHQQVRCGNISIMSNNNNTATSFHAGDIAPKTPSHGAIWRDESMLPPVKRMWSSDKSAWVLCIN
jgi:hypothetical protein